MNFSEALMGLVLYAFVTSITPGPNNMMVLASGVNFGLARSVPHILGISIGFAVMVMSVGAGLGTVFEKFPTSHGFLQWIGAAYLLYLAWKIANSAPPAEADIQPEGKPMGFLAAAAFQWVNPKAWIMALGAITTYLPSESTLLTVIALAAIFLAVNAPCVAAWAVCGAWLRHILTESRAIRIFNIFMALLLVASLYPALIQ